MVPCRFIDVAPALALATAAFLSVFLFTLAPSAKTSAAETGQVAVVFPPWIDLAEATMRTARADGRPVRQGLFGNILVVQPDDGDFVTKIYAQGALLVIDPKVLGGCLVTDPTTAGSS